MSRPPPHYKPSPSPSSHYKGTRRANLVASNANEEVNDLGGVKLWRHCEAVMIEEEEEWFWSEKQRKWGATWREGYIYIYGGLGFLVIWKLLLGLIRPDSLIKMLLLVLLLLLPALFILHFIMVFSIIYWEVQKTIMGVQKVYPHFFVYWKTGLLGSLCLLEIGLCFNLGSCYLHSFITNTLHLCYQL